MKDQKPKPLTEEMYKCLDFIKDKGHIYRHTGGFWAAEDDPKEAKMRQSPMQEYFYYPANHFSAGTIKALERRELIEPTEYKESKDGKSKWAIRYALRSS